MILNIVTQSIGDVDVSPRNVFITTSSSYNDVVTPGFLRNTQNNQFLSTDIINIFYAYSELTKSGIFGQFTASFSADIITLVPVEVPPIISVTGTTKTLSLADQGSIQDCSNVATQTITVPPYSSVKFTYGIPILFKRSGAGVVTFAAGSGVTIQSASSALSIAVQYSQACLIPMSQNSFWLYGNLV